MQSGTYLAPEDRIGPDSFSVNPSTRQLLPACRSNRLSSIRLLAGDVWRRCVVRVRTSVLYNTLHISIQQYWSSISLLLVRPPPSLSAVVNTIQQSTAIARQHNTTAHRSTATLAPSSPLALSTHKNVSSLLICPLDPVQLHGDGRVEAPAHVARANTSSAFCLLPSAANRTNRQPGPRTETV